MARSMEITDFLPPVILPYKKPRFFHYFNAPVLCWEWEKLIRPNPCAHMRKLRENNERLRFLSMDEIKRLCDAWQGELSAFVIFALNTGCRSGEMMALTWQDIDIQQGKIHIRDHYCPVV